MDKGASQHRLCIAPMMGRTDRHFRHLVRLISPRARLFTEMVTADALLHGDSKRTAFVESQECATVLQLGGSEPDKLAACCELAHPRGFSEFNLNCGCPSPRVVSGSFGASLMLRPQLVVRCVTAMRSATPRETPISVKLRLGVDDVYRYSYFRDFVLRLAGAGCDIFHVHARKALLDGLSPRENREVPPLNYTWVYRLKQERPDLTIILNGGVTSQSAVRSHQNRVDGVMIGRHAYREPFNLVECEHVSFPETTSETRPRGEVLEQYWKYAAERMSEGTNFQHIARHALNLFHGCAGSRQWRQMVSQSAHKVGTDHERLAALLERLPQLPP